MLGLSFADMVKTAHCKHPKKYTEETPVESRLDHITAVAEEEEVKLMAWADGRTRSAR